jgi:general secretion pathway protein C
MTSPPRGDLSKLWTGPALAASQPQEQAAPALAARIQMVGAVAPRADNGRNGVALLTVDGRPAQAFKPGQTVESDNIIQSIGPEGVKIGPAGAEPVLTLPLPTMPAAATGTLPPPATVGSASPSPAAAYTPPPVAQAANAGVGMAATGVEGADLPNPDNARVRRLPPRMRRHLVGGPPGGQNTDIQPPGM